MTWWWLSFVDNRKPEGQRFLGGCMVRARDPREATQASWKFGCNPGGCVQLTPAAADFVLPPVAEQYTYKLLSRVELDELDKLLIAANPQSVRT